MIMPGVSSLRKVQLGKETTWGTAVAATAILMGLTNVSFDPQDETYQSPELGVMYPSPHAAEVKQSASVQLECEGTYEDLLYALHGIFGSVSPTGTNPYTWTYSAPTTSAATPQKYSLEITDSASPYVVKGGVLTKLNVKGVNAGIWTWNADLIGKTVATVTPASLSRRTVEIIRGGDTALYVDAVGGTMGSTAVTATLLEWELEVETGRYLKWYQDASGVLPGDFGEAQWSGSLKTILEYNSSAKAYIDSLITPARVQKQIELRATSGTKSAKVQFCGYVDGSTPLWTDRDGTTVVEINWKGEYNTTFANWLKVIVVNAVSALA